MRIISEQNRATEQRPQPLSIEQLAARFDRVQWINDRKCRVSSPLRKDKTPSVYISEAADGKLLIHDFGGDSAVEILNAVGVELGQLFPASPETHYVKPSKERMAAQELIRYLRDDLNLILVFARMVQRGEKPIETDFVAIGKAIDRLHDGLSFGGVR